MNCYHRIKENFSHDNGYDKGKLYQINLVSRLEGKPEQTDAGIVSEKRKNRVLLNLWIDINVGAFIFQLNNETKVRSIKAKKRRNRANI